MSIGGGIMRNMRELKEFGPLFALRHVGRLLGWKTMTLSTSKLGRITVRPGDTDAATFSQVFIGRSYDLSNFQQMARITAAYEEILARGGKPLIIDAGANVGAATLWFARSFPKAVIVAVEPDAGAAAMCRLNTAHLAQIEVLEAAIGATSGNVVLQTTGASWGTQTVRSDGDGVRVVTVPDIVRSAGPAASLFIAKVDIEGFEKDLFSSQTEWVEATPVVMIEPHDWLFPGRGTGRGFMQTFARTGHELLIAGGDTLAFVR
jgi:FkbM family methyltransferase